MNKTTSSTLRRFPSYLLLALLLYFLFICYLLIPSGFFFCFFPGFLAIFILSSNNNNIIFIIFPWIWSIKNLSDWQLRLFRPIYEVPRWYYYIKVPSIEGRHGDLRMKHCEKGSSVIGYICYFIDRYKLGLSSLGRNITNKPKHGASPRTSHGSIPWPRKGVARNSEWGEYWNIYESDDIWRTGKLYTWAMGM